MAIRRIVELGDSLLRAKSEEVTVLSEAFGTLDDLRDTLHEFQRTHGFGRGIAAVQIGVLQRVIYIEIDGAAYELVNPVLEWISPETFEMWDDCFSFPNLMVRLRRSVGVKVRYQDRAGTTMYLSPGRAFSELLQHEIDHLDGILSIDRAVDPKDSFSTRGEYLRTLLNNPLRPD